MMPARQLVLWLALLSSPAMALAQTSCITCHGDADVLDEDSVAIVTAFHADVHADVGLSCHDCHGGNPDASLAEDMDAAMDSDFVENPYRGIPTRREIPEFCGRCHSDPEYMRRYAPAQRVDQVTEYWTSVHGKQLRAGDEKVATCIDCHGVHGIARADVPQSAVYPTNVATTCGRCHADADYMASYELPNGSPMPVNQLAFWEQSVHANAMHNKGDLSAPTCNDCHGNHGATPPGLASVGFVCGQCHGREAGLFRASAKHQGIQDHREYIQESECADCHDLAGAEAGMRAPHGFAECSSCHGNHGIVRPTVAMLSPLPDSPCAFCHDQQEAEGAILEAARARQNYHDTKASLEAAADAEGLEGAFRFDWLTDQALTLPYHTQAGETAGVEPRPEFARLFEKFRIGKTHYSYTDPVTGEQALAEVTRCSDCHAGQEEPASRTTAEAFVNMTRELTSKTAQAERMLLQARRGGVETREALEALDQAVDAQIQLEVLVHTFDPGGEFAATHQEGIEHAQAAMAASQRALEELSTRRRGLYVALFLSALVVVALGLKIRSLNA